MDVRCSRCATDYDFDDALISEHGTTVKCTQCGHQFKLFPPAGKAGPDRWTVRSADGNELVYSSLKDLQRAITEGRAKPQDLLARGSDAPRPLASIAELDAFFRAQPKSSSLRPKTITLHGVGPESLTTTSASRPESLASNPPDTQTSVAEYRVHDAPRAALPSAVGQEPQAEAPRVGSTKPALYSPVPERPRELPPNTVVPQTKPYGDILPNTEPLPEEPPPKVAAPNKRQAKADSGSPELGARASAAVAPALSEDQMPGPQSSPDPVSLGTALRTMDLNASVADVPGVPRRGGSLRWLGLVVIVCLLGFLALTLGEKYLQPSRAPEPAESETQAQRVAEYLKSAQGHLHAGDFDAAKEQIDQALGVSGKNADALAARAELECIRADLQWLKLRLIDPSNRPFQAAVQAEFRARLKKAESAIQASENLNLGAVQRARIDWLRMQDRLKEARGLVPVLAQDASKANLYTLSALDLAESQPADFTAVAERLKMAVLGEGALGRARAALIYALVRSGRLTEANSEFETLAKQSSLHPLAEVLRHFLERASSDRASEASGAGEASNGEGTEKASPAASVNGEVSPAPAQRAKEVTFQVKLQAGTAALRAGDLEKADRLFQEVLIAQPQNTEALAGRADIARRRGDERRAAQLYDQVLQVNPSYLPALMGRADYLWDTGSRDGARALYRRVLDQAGASSAYGRRAQARLDQPASSSAPNGAKREAPKAPAPHIDTTDLPGVLP